LSSWESRWAVAIIGTVFFSLVGGPGGVRLESALDGAERASLVTFGLIAMASWWGSCAQEARAQGGH